MEKPSLSTLLATNGIRLSVLKDLSEHGITKVGPLGRKWRRESSELEFLFQLRSINKATMIKFLDNAAQIYVNSIQGKLDEATSSNQTTPRSDKKNPPRDTTPSNLKNLLKVDASNYSSSYPVTPTIFRGSQPPPVNHAEDINKVQEMRSFQPVLNGVVPPIYPKFSSVDLPQTPPFTESKTRANSHSEAPFSPLPPTESFKKETAFHSSKTKKTESSMYDAHDHHMTSPQKHSSSLVYRGDILSRHAQEEEKGYTLDGKDFRERIYREPQSSVRMVPSKLDDLPAQSGTNPKVSLRKPSPPRDRIKGVDKNARVIRSDKYDIDFEGQGKKLPEQHTKELERIDSLRKEMVEAQQLATEEERQRQKVEARRAEQQRAAEERQRVEAQQRAAQQRAAEDRQRVEAQQREAEERQKVEAQQRAAQQRAAEDRQRVEAQQRAAEERQKVEAQQRAAEERQRVEAQQRAAQQRAAEDRQKVEAQQLATEEERQRQKVEARRAAQQRAAEERQKVEAQQRAAEERQRVEAQQRAAQQRAAEDRQKVEAQQRAAEERQKVEAQQRAAQQREAEERQKIEAQQRGAQQREAEERQKVEAQQRPEHMDRPETATSNYLTVPSVTEYSTVLPLAINQTFQLSRKVPPPPSIIGTNPFTEPAPLTLSNSESNNNDTDEVPPPSSLTLLLQAHHQASDAIDKCEKMGLMSLKDLLNSSETMVESLMKALKAIPRKKLEAFIKAAREGRIGEKVNEIDSQSHSSHLGPVTSSNISPISEFVSSEATLSKKDECECFEGEYGETIIIAVEEALKKEALILEFERENQIIEDISNLIVNETKSFTKAALEVMTQSKVNHQERAKRLKRLIQKAGGKTPLRGGGSSSSPATVTSDRYGYTRNRSGKSINFHSEVITYSMRNNSHRHFDKSSGNLKPSKYSSRDSSGMSSSETDKMDNKPQLSTEEKRLQEKQRIDELELKKTVDTSNCWECSVCHRFNELSRPNCPDCFTPRIKVANGRSASSGRYQSKTRQDIPPLVDSLTDSNVKISYTSHSVHNYLTPETENRHKLYCAICNVKYQCKSKDARCKYCDKFLIPL